jgi:uncharacterized membrane protein YdfJ with MMPL/SSD domain
VRNLSRRVDAERLQRDPRGDNEPSVTQAYDETGDTSRAIAFGLARTGKLVTSAALVLMFAFFVLATGPGVDIKQFGIGLAAGIIFDATVIRALLVPSIMRLAGSWNWWLPKPMRRILRSTACSHALPGSLCSDRAQSRERVLPRLLFLRPDDVASSLRSLRSTP